MIICAEGSVEESLELYFSETVLRGEDASGIAGTMLRVGFSPDLKMALVSTSNGTEVPFRVARCGLVRVPGLGIFPCHPEWDRYIN